VGQRVSDLPDFKLFCEAACIKLWGEPDRRTKKELRWNGADVYNGRTFNPRKRAWYDLGQQRGGSTLELVAYAKGKPAEKLRGRAFFETWEEAHKMGLVPDPPPSKSNSGGKPILATYPYHDEQGLLLFQVVRFDTNDVKERFRQRRPDGGGGGWIWDVQGIRRILYRLPELIAAVNAGQRVLVCEGEKDTNTAVKLGYAATTNPGGVGKWKKEFDTFFVGADVIIVSDNDPPGQHHAASIAKHLRKVAAHVRTVIFPQKDLSEWVAAGGTREQLDALIEQAPDQIKQPSEESAGANLPELIINNSDPTAAAKQLAALISQRDDFLFNGNWPVQIMAEVGAMPRAIEVAKESVRVLAHEICRPVKITHSKRGTETEAVSLSNDVALLYLHGLQGRWNLRPFRGITTAPILSNDGHIRIASGYDPATGLWCHNVPTLSVPDKPSGKEAKAALERLRYVFRTFPFADGKQMRDQALGIDAIDPTHPPGLDESSFMAALLTGVCRQCLDFAPGFLCDAPTFSGAGTGKGLLVKAICIISSGVRPSAFTSGHNAEEFDKRLTAALVQAHPAVFLDNFNSKELKSDILASALTENPAMVRVMGQTKNVPLYVQTFIGITGNGVQPSEDMARRIITTHLDAKMENPEERKFRPGFLDDILATRAELLTDTLTIWRWGRQNPGALNAGKALGSYELWCEWVRDPLLTLGMHDPVERIAEIKASDPRRRELVELFDTWWEAHEDQQIKVAQLALEVIQHIDTAATQKDGKNQFNRQKVARFLAQRADTRIGGYHLEREEGGKASKPVALYKLHSRERP
jgi:hypothetical protein